MQKVLELFITSPAGQRLAHSAIRQGLQYLGGMLMAYLALQGTPFESEWADLSTKVASVVAPLLVLWWTQKRAKVTERTIEVAIESPKNTPRAEIEAKASGQ
jgi:hypothetical protein